MLTHYTRKAAMIKKLGIAILVMSMSILAKKSVSTETILDTLEYTDHPLEQSTTTGSTKDQVILDVAQRVLSQLKDLDHTLEEIGLAVNSKVAKVEDKEAVAAHVLSLREILGQYIGAHSPTILRGKPELASVRTLLDVNKGMVGYLKNAVQDGFTSMDTFDEGSLITRNRLDSALDIKDVTLELDTLAHQIHLIDKEIKHIGYSTMNRIAKRIASFDKKLRISKLAYRSLPYMGVGIYLAWANNALPFVNTVEFLRPVNAKPSNAGAAKAGAANAEPANLGSKETATKTSSTSTDTWNIAQEWLKNLVTVAIGHEQNKVAIFNFAVGGALAPVLYKDIEELSEWIGHQCGKTKAYFQGKPYDDGKPIKLSRICMKDVVGAENPKRSLNPIIDYFKKRAEHDRAGAYIDRGYFLVGPLDTSKYLAYAIAGDVTEFYKAKGKSTEMSVYEIHSSELLSKELKTIVKEACEKSPCIVLIKDLDWLHSQPRVDAKVWSDLASTMGGILVSKKHVFVIATAQEASVLASHHKDLLGMVIQVNYPTQEDRAEYFKRELEKRSIVITRFDIPTLARETKGCTFTQLLTILNRALNSAHTAKEILSQSHLENAINEVAHGIVVKTPDEHERKILAAHYAGKTLAHKLLLPDQPLKVTIYPVIKGDTCTAGALISYCEELAQTDKMIETQCIIDFAGAQAQKLIIGTEWQQMSKPHLIQAKIKKIVLNGIREDELSEESREKKLQEVEAKMVELESKALELIDNNKGILAQLAEQLEEHLTLNDQAIEICMTTV